MAFNLSNRSKKKLEGVHPDMVAVVERAIEITKVDFGVTYGVRTVEEQEKLVASGRSQTMKSKHLIQDSGYSHAVDVVAYDGISIVIFSTLVAQLLCDNLKELNLANFGFQVRYFSGGTPQKASFGHQEHQAKCQNHPQNCPNQPQLMLSKHNS